MCFWKRLVNTLFKRLFIVLFINAVWVHLCSVGRDLKKTLGLGEVESSKGILRMKFLVILTACVAVGKTFIT